MAEWQQLFLLAFAVFNFLVFLKALDECKNKNNAFGLTSRLLPIGAFVWGDAVVFGLFWAAASLTTLFLQDWLLFWLVTSIFWVIRSLGETIYWFNQQFSTINRNPPEKLPFHRIFHNDSIWFVEQIIWQCATVISIIASLYLAKLWLGGL